MPNNAGDDLTGLNNYRYDDSGHYRYTQLLDPGRLADQRALEDVRPRAASSSPTRTANDYTNGIDTLKMRRTEGSQRNGFNIAARLGLHLQPDHRAHGPGARTTRPIDRRNYPEMNIGEEGYSDLWPSGWWEPYASGRPDPLLPELPDPERRHLRRPQLLVAAAVRLQRRRQAQQVLRQALGQGRDRRALEARRRLALRLRQPDVHRQRDARTRRRGRTRRPAIRGRASCWGPWIPTTSAAAASSVQFVPMQTSNTEMYARLRAGRLHRHRQADAQPRPALRVRERLLGPAEPAAAAARPDRPDPGDAGRHRPEDPGRHQGQDGPRRPARRATSTTAPSTSPRRASKYATSSYKLQFMPRVGLAYRLDDKTALRARLRALLHAANADRQRQRAAGQLRPGRVQPHHERPAAESGRAAGLPQRTRSRRA